MARVVSGAINDIAYDEDTKAMKVVFKDGKTYRYDGVDYSIYQSIVTAPSVGQAFNFKFRGVPGTPVAGEI